MTNFKSPDIYGQRHPRETPGLIKSKLREFDEQIGKIPESDKESLSTAETKCPDLLTDDFKLMFLRCEVFHVDLAVSRYIQYWEKRVEAFGSQKAFEPLTQDRALRDDGPALHTGFFQVVGTHGAGGRSIVFCDPSLQERADYTTDSMLRVIWYMMHAALENENTQKRGFIFLVYCWRSNMSHFDRDLTKRIVSFVKGSLPVRLSGMHFCRPTRILSTVFPLIKFLMGEHLRKRIRVHSRSESRAQAELDKYELYKDVIPQEVGGTVELDHDRWLEERRMNGK